MMYRMVRLSYAIIFMFGVCLAGLSAPMAADKAKKEKKEPTKPAKEESANKAEEETSQKNVIDLASIGEKTTNPAKPGVSIDVEIVNMLVNENYAYDVSVKVRTFNPQKLPAPNIPKLLKDIRIDVPSGGANEAFRAPEDSTGPPQASLTALESLKIHFGATIGQLKVLADEKEVPTMLGRLDSLYQEAIELLNEEKTSETQDDKNKWLFGSWFSSDKSETADSSLRTPAEVATDRAIFQESRQAAIDATRQLYSDIAVLKEGQRAVVTITRKHKTDTAADKGQWTVTLQAGELPEFEVLYGFSVVSNAFSKRERFFTRQVDSADFRIESAGQKGLSDIDLAPTIFYAWYPGREADRKVEWGFMAGPGYENGALALSAGWFVTFHRNIGIGIGVSAHKTLKLRYQYADEDEDSDVKSLLDEETLHEKSYTVDPFVTLLFRFDGNPFF